MPARWRRIARWVVVGLVLVLLELRLGDVYQALLGSELNSDIPGYVDGARRMCCFYDSGYREPFAVVWYKLAFLFTDDSERAARTITVAQTFFTALGVYAFGAVFFGWLIGVLALALFASSMVVQFYAVSGLRDPLFTALLLLFALALFRPWPVRRWWIGALLVGVSGALLALTRIYAVAIVLCAIVLWLGRARVWQRDQRRPALLFAAVALGVATLLVTPDFVVRPRASVSDNVRFIDNLEHGRDPNTPWTGEPVGLVQYLVTDHSAPELVRRFTWNYVLYVRDYLPPYLRALRWLALFFPVGVVVALLRRRGFVVGLWLLALAPVVFILNLDQAPGQRGVELRLVYQAFPLTLVLALYGLGWTLAQALRLLARRLPKLQRASEVASALLLPRPPAISCAGRTDTNASTSGSMHAG